MPPIISKPFVQTLDLAILKEAQIKADVLRLDAIHPIISGNKWLKLAPWLDEVKASGAAGLLSTGGAWSNFLHAAGFVCASLGLSFTAVVRARQGMLTPVITDLLKWKAKIIYEPASEIYGGRDWQEIARSHHQLYIPMGGEGKKGVFGVCSYLNSLDLAAYDSVFCPLGTGTTCLGILESRMSFKTLYGINVGLKPSAYEDLQHQISQNFPHKSFSILYEPTLKAFGKCPPFLPAFMSYIQQSTNLPTDIVYTSKMMFIFMDLVKKQHFEPGSTILLTHTGGLQGNRSLGGKILCF